MQTFLPYNDILKSIQVLDNKRLGKQRVEANQILMILFGEENHWKNHPAVLMWEGYTELLKYYFNCTLKEWCISRKKNNTMFFWEVEQEKIVYPYWWSDERIFRSHRCNLLRKDYSHYSQYFIEDDIDAPYFWPTGLKNKKMNEKMLKYWERK